MAFKEAVFYKQIGEKKVHCSLCPHSCFIDNGEVGKCEVKQNVNGRLKSMNYGKTHSVVSGKVEDVNLFHFLPGKEVLKVGCPGRNLFGKFYKNENDERKLEDIPTLSQTPSKILNHAKKTDSRIIAYSHGEPVAFYEYMKDVMDNGKDFKHVVVTNGFIGKPAIKEIAKKADAIVFDIHSMNDVFYDQICGGKIEPILEAIRAAYLENVWIEIKMTLINGAHDNFYDVRKLISYALHNLNTNIPLHFIAYNNESIELCQKSRKIALAAGMNYVYIDNVNDEEANTMSCPNCKKPLTRRIRGKVLSNLKKGRCKCGKEIPGIWR